MKSVPRSALIVLAALLCLPAAVMAAEEGGNRVVHLMTNLVIQLGVILFAARLGGELFAKAHLPSVLGELAAGILIGPYLFGAVPLPGFPDGLFPIPPGSALPVRPELYAIATIASIVLLFNVGLETDISMFLRFSLPGFVVGMGGVVVSFTAGAYVCSLVLGIPFTDPQCLFMGVISTATSVGITARILFEARRMDSPEGVTILASAVIDDVVGIVLLAVVVGIGTAVEAGNSHIPWGHIGQVAGKAVLVWLAFTALGLAAAPKIGAFLKAFGSIPVFSILALGVALVVAGLFEKAGLAMIIGAYVTGLSLARTDLRYVIQGELQTVYVLLVPVFFTVTGMLVNIKALASPQVLLLGVTYSAAAILAKVVGCGLPALALNFNRIGALRIGLGMAPRSEVALIIASAGLSYHILSHSTFGATVFMTLLSVIIAPALLTAALRKGGKGTRKETAVSEKTSIPFTFPSRHITDIVAGRVIDHFRSEGFFIHTVEADCRIYHLDKGNIFITLLRYPESLEFHAARDDVVFVNTIVYEALLEIHEAIGKLKHLAKPESMRKELAKGGRVRKISVGKVMRQSAIKMELAAESKDQVIEEMIDMLCAEGKVDDREKALEAVRSRERSMSTGMQHGIALPHGKCDAVSSMAVAIAFKRDGLDFQSIDGLPSRIFFLVLSPEQATGPHIQFLAGISALLNSEGARNKLLSCRNSAEVVSFFAGR